MLDSNLVLRLRTHAQQHSNFRYVQPTAPTFAPLSTITTSISSAAFNTSSSELNVNADVTPNDTEGTVTNFYALATTNPALTPTEARELMKNSAYSEAVVEYVPVEDEWTLIHRDVFGQSLSQSIVDVGTAADVPDLSKQFSLLGSLMSGSLDAEFKTEGKYTFRMIPYEESDTYDNIPFGTRYFQWSQTENPTLTSSATGDAGYQNDVTVIPAEFKAVYDAYKDGYPFEGLAVSEQTRVWLDGERGTGQYQYNMGFSDTVREQRHFMYGVAEYLYKYPHKTELWVLKKGTQLPSVMTKVLDTNNQIVDISSVNYANVFLYGTDGNPLHDAMDTAIVDPTTNNLLKMGKQSLYYQDFPTGQLNTKGTFDLTQNVSFSVKFRIDHSIETIPDTALLFSFGPSSSTFQALDIRNTSGLLGFHTPGGNNANYPLVQGVWYTACIVYSSSSGPSLYVEGSARSWDHSVASHVRAPSSASYLSMGGIFENFSDWNSSRGYSIGEFKVFRESLTSAQVADLDAQTPYLHYTFDNAHRDGLYKLGPYADNSGKTDDSAVFEAATPIVLSEEADGSWSLPLNDVIDGRLRLSTTYPFEHSNNRVKSSVAFWLYLNKYPSYLTYTTYNVALFQMLGSTSGQRQYYIWYDGTTTRMCVSSGVAFHCPIPEFNLNTWYHVCVVFDDHSSTPESQKIYFNGTLLTPDQTNSTMNCYGDEFTFHFGPNASDDGDDGGQDVGMYMGDLMVYNAVLSDAEVQELYTTDAVAAKTPMAHYTFEDNTRSADKLTFYNKYDNYDLTSAYVNLTVPLSRYTGVEVSEAPYLNIPSAYWSRLNNQLVINDATVFSSRANITEAYGPVAFTSSTDVSDTASMWTFLETNVTPDANLAVQRYEVGSTGETVVLEAYNADFTTLTPIVENGNYYMVMGAKDEQGNSELKRFIRGYISSELVSLTKNGVVSESDYTRNAADVMRSVYNSGTDSLTRATINDAYSHTYDFTASRGYVMHVTDEFPASEASHLVNGLYANYDATGGFLDRASGITHNVTVIFDFLQPVYISTVKVFKYNGTSTASWDDVIISTLDDYDASTPGTYVEKDRKTLVSGAEFTESHINTTARYVELCVRKSTTTNYLGVGEIEIMGAIVGPGTRYIQEASSTLRTVLTDAAFENNQLTLSGEVTADYESNTTFRALGTTNPSLTQTQALALIDSYKENTSLVITDTVDARDTVELGEAQGEWILLNRDVASESQNKYNSKRKQRQSGRFRKELQYSR